MMKPDLHTHTFLSDGQHSPQHIVDLAINNGVTHLAITDHDCVSKINVNIEPPEALKLIPGVEISANWSNKEIHVVGLFIDSQNPNLNSLLGHQQELRRQRVALMDTKLEALGTPGLVSHMESLPCISWTRSHVADFLVANNVCPSRQKAFKTHLGKKGKLWTTIEWCGVGECVTAIADAGGLAILAHPGRYKFNRSELSKLVAEFKATGGAGLEVEHPNLDPSMATHLQELARENQLYLSCGSDFHDASATWSNVGKFKPLRERFDNMAVWHHPRWAC